MGNTTNEMIHTLFIQRSVAHALQVLRSRAVDNLATTITEAAQAQRRWLVPTSSPEALAVFEKIRLRDTLTPRAYDQCSDVISSGDDSVSDVFDYDGPLRGQEVFGVVDCIHPAQRELTKACAENPEAYRAAVHEMFEEKDAKELYAEKYSSLDLKKVRFNSQDFATIVIGDGLAPTERFPTNAPEALDIMNRRSVNTINRLLTCDLVHRQFPRRDPNYPHLTQTGEHEYVDDRLPTRTCSLCHEEIHDGRCRCVIG